MGKTEHHLLSRRNPAYLGRFLEAVEAVRLQNPAEALEMAETGLRLAALIPADIHGHEACQLAAAQAWGVLGGVLRTLDRYCEAEWAYRLSAKYLRWGNADKSERALLGRRIAFLRRDQGKFIESRRFLAFAVECYRSTKQSRQLGQAFSDMGRTLFVEGEDLSSAQRYLERSLRYLTVEDDAYLLASRLTLLDIYSVQESGYEPDRLLELVQEVRLHPACTDGSLIEAKAQHVLGRAQHQAGRRDEAVAAFEKASRNLQQLDSPTAAALVTMDLAMLWLEHGCYDECRRLAGQAFPIFKALRHNAEATSALTLFVKSATQGQLDMEITRQVRRQLQLVQLA